ncbi:hypothetical protein [Kamptonema sp. UHCC 0994]|uniref:hypothetical protein n=1 Tax=Kamptonema sp. UHCC 0994 TaxID=3031329 RepID=UPI0023B99607|nr:hypothetical protein [Kamptonema sp. UHCC 0994]MDF0551781.1 hypothetical protein [Kamptonema sp. UHCC 0994]
MKKTPKTTYFTILNQYKGIALITFATIITAASITAYCLAPPPGYTAEGALITNTPPVKFSTIGGAILKQGEKLTADDLLADNVVKAVADAAKIEPQQVRQNASVKVSEPEKPLEITVEYRAEDRQQTLTTADVLMKAIVEKSRLINLDKWQLINQSINQRLEEVTKELKQAEQNLDQFYQGDERERSRLEEQVKLQQGIYDKTQSALADAKAAEKEISSSLAVSQAPQIIAYPGSNPIVPITLGTGLIIGLAVSGGLIPLFAAWKQKGIQKKQERHRLQEILYRLIQEGSGEITLVRFAMETQLSAEEAQEYLNQQAEAFNATCEVKKEGSISYHFKY